MAAFIPSSIAADAGRQIKDCFSAGIEIAPRRPGGRLIGWQDRAFKRAQGFYMVRRDLSDFNLPSYYYGRVYMQC